MHTQNLIAFAGHPPMTDSIRHQIVAVCYEFVLIMYEIHLSSRFAICNPATYTHQIIRTNYPLDDIFTGMFL